VKILQIICLVGDNKLDHFFKKFVTQKGELYIKLFSTLSVFLNFIVDKYSLR